MNSVKFSKEEWDTIFAARGLQDKAESTKKVLDFFQPRLKKILETNELQPFETEQELTLDEYLNLTNQEITNGNNK